MKLLEFVLSEIDKVFKKEVYSRHEKQDAKELYNCVDLITVKDGELEKLYAFFLSHEELSKLTKTIKYIGLLFDCYDDNEFMFIEKQIKKNTSDKILIILWILAKRAKFSHEEFFDIELIEFFEKVFNKYSFVFKIENFLEITEFFNITFNSDEIVKEKLIPVLEKAITEHTDNLVVVKMLVNIYYKFGYLSKAEKLINKTVLEIEEYNLHIKYQEIKHESKEDIYINLLLTRALINYKLNYFDKALKETSFVIGKLISSFDNNADDIVFINYELAVLIPLSIQLKQNNTKEFKKYINYLEKHWHLLIVDEWEDGFPEIIDYIKNNKLLES